jgi:hypothetical protein
MPDYIIKPAPYSFTCPLYGDQVKKGENCVEENGALFCIKILEERKLVPVKKHSLPGDGNPFGRGSVRWENLMMRLELETIAADPDGGDAKKIITKYRRKMKAREERYLSTQN